jgi:ABC-type multidrug transport system ATPase subunit
MKQRLGIAQSMLHDPELLILDEPASGLDPAGNRDVRELIHYLNEEKGKTILLSSHHLSEIEHVAKRVLIISEGKKVVEGNVKELLTQQSYQTVFKTAQAVKAAKLMEESTFDCGPYEVNGDMMHIRCLRKEVADINIFLVENGIRIESIKMDQNLEEFFLNMT